MMIKRRQFLLSIAGTAAAGLAGWRLFSGSAHTAGLTKVVRAGWALGTNVQLTVFHPDQKIAEEALTDAFAALNRVEDLMSLYRPGSELSRLNAAGRLSQPSADLVKVLRTAERLSMDSEGAFDVTVQPLWALYAKHAQADTQPTAEELRATLEQVGWRRVGIADDAIVLRGEGTAITLNGIAQGYAADCVTEVLKGHGIAYALIDTGEIGVIGHSPEKDHWAIGIKDPRNTGEILEIAALRGRCLATSGDYETAFDEQFINHHLIDPHTGHSPVELASVSIVAPTALQADALSTAVFLMGMAKGRALVEATPGVDAYFVTKTGERSSTPGFPSVG